ncbi:hypothetical protein HNP84_001943 [Thermocatellispora tengchongensis]|uniref:DUF320 domain-containing protein n=1 Tax=Thermocatellispora tengchongensis TaxID=1073253 RepID=A0A840P4S5_9ACTN|nr:hypothetical protein [Thermocatellispora tengchongensis]MBB5132227.1 hypothetical protein [Thermocatellispora tengchongensis]
MFGRGVVGAVRLGVGGVAAGLLAVAAPAHADTPEPGGGGSSLLGDIVIFNDEIVEPVSVPVSSCGKALVLFGKATTTCKGATSVSDDDA